MITDQPIGLAGARLRARSSGALWWAEERVLCVADLHLGKAERAARRGGALLPPYDTTATLDRLGRELDRLDPRTILCLGDSFDDPATRLSPGDAERLCRLMDGRDWTWIAGNHDPLPPEHGGNHCSEKVIGPLIFRHIACLQAAPGEVSGHYHPKYRLRLKGLSLSRPCFLFDARRLVLPAFGAYAGGLGADHPALRALFTAPAAAVLTGEPCVRLPFPEASGQA